LYNPQDAERTNVTARSLQLRTLRESPEKLCNLDKYLTCDDATNKCACFEELIEQDGECKIKNLDNCEDAYVIGEDLYHQRSEQLILMCVFLRDV